ncbi:MAG: LysM peptidoglycan-binding domain-containing protein [Treponema sp.]|nr:LysM peptidoglycan-binding domain-containing protein [Treponema sp.]
MNKKNPDKSNIKTYWFVDLLVVIIFLSIAAFSILLFRNDLMRSIETRDETPVGQIIIRNNVVQRRYADRVLWERLFVDSPVYSGDLIRAADLSAASIHIDENQINLNENTLIRITQAPDGKGPFHVDLREGNLSVSTSSGTGLILNIMGKQVHAAPGTVLNAELGEEGMVVRVSEGNAVLIEESGESRELSQGMIIAHDIEGTELIIAAAVVTYPQPNARFLKSTEEMIPISFSWNRINLKPEDTLHLQIANDKNFTRNIHLIQGLDSNAQSLFDTGNWHWRLLFVQTGLADSVLSVGEFTVTDGSGPDLLSPVMNSVFRYHTDPPQLRFQWLEKSGASYYILEVSDTHDFANLVIRRQVTAASFIQSELGEGTWYWRVRPGFSSAYEGSTGYSSISYFRIEKSADTRVAVIEVPQPPSRERYYKVQPGDFLSLIAEIVYNDFFQWQRIFEANDIEDPDLIYVDQILIIPKL